MEKEGSKLRWYSFRIVDGKEDRPIYKYMDLDHLIAMFETKQFYVKRRRDYEDANESYKNIKLRFGFKAVGENVPPQLDAPERMVIYDKLIDLPTSCWTDNENESYLMWKGYTSKIGVCIKSSIHHLVSALDIETSEKEHNRILCGSMKYEEFKPSTDEEKQLFGKDFSYSDEHEFRFYFNLPWDNKKDDSLIIPILPDVLIDKVIISPFVNSAAANKLANILRCCYNIKDVSLSKIKIKQ